MYTEVSLQYYKKNPCFGEKNPTEVMKSSNELGDARNHQRPISLCEFSL